MSAKEIAASLLPKYKGEEAIFRISNEKKTIWMSHKLVDLNSGTDLVRSKIKDARALNSQFFVFQGIEPDGLSRSQIKKRQWHPLVVAPETSALEVIKLARVGTEGDQGQNKSDSLRSEMLERVQKAFSKIMRYADFHITYAASHSLEAYLLEPVSKKTAKAISETVLKLNHTVLTYGDGREQWYCDEVLNQRRVFLNFYLS